MSSQTAPDPFTGSGQNSRRLRGAHELRRVPGVAAIPTTHKCGKANPKSARDLCSMVGSEVSWHGTPAADAVFLIDSFFGKLVAAITVSLLIGIVVDLSISVAHPFGATTTLQVPGVSSFCTTCGVLGALAGGGAGGPVGAAVGFLWGWVLSKLVDSTTSKYVSELMRPVTIPAISWLAAALAGWMAGRTASRWFSKLAAGRPTLARFIGAIAVIAALASAAIVLLQFGLWMSPRLADIPPLMAQVLSVL